MSSIRGPGYFTRIYVTCEVTPFPWLLDIRYIPVDIFYVGPVFKLTFGYKIGITCT